MAKEYKTQMEAARKGIVTPEIEKVAAKEHMSVDELLPLVACGKVAIPANVNHKCLEPEGIGSMLRTKINVNLGVSRDCKDYDVEMEKVMSAVNMGAEAIMDLSSHGNTQPFRRKLTSECPVMIGTVPVYDSVIHYQRDLDTLTAKDFIDVIRLHAEDGVDFVTLHCGITRKTIDQIKKHKRKMNIVSRGGSLVFAWMSMTGNENPFYEYYDEILDICREYDVTISLGDACRPGCLADATDAVGFVIFGVVTTIVMFASGYHVRKKYLTELDFYLAEHPEISPNKLQSAFRTYFFLKRTRLFALLFATAIPWYILSPNNKDAFEMRDYLTLGSFAILALVCVGLHFYGKKRYAQ